MSGSDLDNWIVISQAAWENTKNMLPSLQLLYGNVYWNPVNGQGLCMHVAAWLYLLLRQEGKAPLLASVQGHLIGHAFIHCDGFLLDPTAMQFGASGPLVQRIQDAVPGKTPWYYQNAIMHRNLASFCQHLNQIGVSSAQIPQYLVGVEVDLNASTVMFQP